MDIVFSRNGLTDDEKGILRRHHETLIGHIENGGLRESYLADDAFHMAAIVFSGNSRLLQFFQAMRNQMMRTRYITTTLIPDWFNFTADQHHHLLTIWLDSDPNTIKETLIEHLNSFSIYIHEVLRKNPEHRHLPHLAKFFEM